MLTPFYFTLFLKEKESNKKGIEMTLWTFAQYRFIWMVSFQWRELAFFWLFFLFPPRSTFSNFQCNFLCNGLFLAPLFNISSKILQRFCKSCYHLFELKVELKFGNVRGKWKIQFFFLNEETTGRQLEDKKNNNCGRSNSKFYMVQVNVQCMSESHPDNLFISPKTKRN